MAGGLGMDVSVQGAADLRADLRRFAPDLSADLQRTLSQQAASVAAAARPLVPADPPLSGWGRAWQGDRLRWSGARARAGIKGTTARGRRTRDGFYNVVVARQDDPAGAVFELAGRGGGTGQFTRALTGKRGEASRAVWRAAEQRGAAVLAAVTAAVNRAEAELSRRIASGGGGRP